jgi:hypothetical protein
MVTGRQYRAVQAGLLTAVVIISSGAEQQEPLLNRLDPLLRGVVLMALVGLVIVGLSLMALTWLGGRRVRRLARSRPPARDRELSDWDRKQPAIQDDGESGEPD